MPARPLLWIMVILCFATVGLWVVATFTGWVNEPAFISHISMAALLAAFGAWAESAAIRRKQERHEDEND